MNYKKLNNAVEAVIDNPTEAGLQVVLKDLASALAAKSTPATMLATLQADFNEVKHLLKEVA